MVILSCRLVVPATLFCFAFAFGTQEISSKHRCSDSLFIHLLNAVNKLEQKLQKQEEKHTNEMKKIQDEHKKDIAELKKTLSSSRPVVAFHVALSGTQSAAGKVVFDKIISNYGNCWNSVTHTFKAPVKGLYFFTVTIMNGNKEQIYVKIMRGKSILQYARADGAHLYNMGTASVVVLLNAGEHVYGQKSHHGIVHGPTAQYPHFVGYLIQKIK